MNAFVIVMGMVATFLNCITVIIGSCIGILLGKKINSEIKDVFFISAGLISIVIGMNMAFESKIILYIIFSLFTGGILGSIWRIEERILNLGSFFERHFTLEGKKRSSLSFQIEEKLLSKENIFPIESLLGKNNSSCTESFSHGFLNASVLFCVGAMTIVGAIKAGTEGDYDLLIIKSVLDGFMAIILTAAMGIGVMFSAIIILLYQGGLTLFARWISPLIGERSLSELSGLGGILIIMIGINLLGFKKIKTANYIPGLFIILILTSLKPLFLLLFT